MITVQAFDYRGRLVSEKSFNDELDALEQQEKYEADPMVSETRILGEVDA